MPGKGLCRKCYGKPREEPCRCQQCALAIPDHSHTFCGDCLAHPPPFRRSITAFPYAPPWSLLIHRFKDQRDLASGRFLSEALLEKIRVRDDDRPDLLVPVPMHPARMRRRGYNQSLEICRHLARRLDIQVMANALFSSVNTGPQKKLGKIERQRNLRRVFEIKPDTAQQVAGRNIAIIDDVMTTGSTASVLAELLLKHGARAVEVWCLARTDRD